MGKYFSLSVMLSALAAIIVFAIIQNAAFPLQTYDTSGAWTGTAKMGRKPKAE